MNPRLASPMSSDDGVPSRSAVETFFFMEARILDEWRLEDWLGLLTASATYQVLPLALDAAEAERAVYLVDDDHARLRARVGQLLRRNAWAENPRSRTRRLITNVEVERDPGSGHVLARANFAVWRFKNELTDVYVGRYQYLLEQVDASLRVAQRQVLLDLEALRPHGKLSFVL